jgi:hypothetical protein
VPCLSHHLADEEDTASEDEEKAAGWGQEDTYIVDCPCGVTFDDGHMMIECENCKVWAHTECLQMQMVGGQGLNVWCWLLLGLPVLRRPVRACRSLWLECVSACGSGQWHSCT